MIANDWEIELNYKAGKMWKAIKCKSNWMSRDLPSLKKSNGKGKTEILGAENSSQISHLLITMGWRILIKNVLNKKGGEVDKYEFFFAVSRNSNWKKTFLIFISFEFFSGLDDDLFCFAPGTKQNKNFHLNGKLFCLSFLISASYLFIHIAGLGLDWDAKEKWKEKRKWWKMLLLLIASLREMVAKGTWRDCWWLSEATFHEVIQMRNYSLLFLLRTYFVWSNVLLDYANNELLISN